MLGSMSTNYMTTIKTTVWHVCITHNGNWNNEQPYEVRSREFCPSGENTNNEIFVPSTINQLHEFTLSNVLNERTVSLDMPNSSNDGNHMNIHMLNKTLPGPNILMNDSICYYVSH
ncbi:unnamed protein product [Schistosoma intercalatum]|nr:unnamed protein product [Schistosoma intercalatum]CAH8596637.1 unnamed protein product [Schistosoma intercalatum]